MLFKKFLLGSILTAVSLFSQATLINFDEIDTNEMVNDFYLSEGAQFQSNDWLVSTGFGETSAPNFATTLSGTSAINFLDGFYGQLSFSYGAFIDSTISIYDEENGAGNLLAFFSLDANNINSFDFMSVTFSGIGYSAVFQSQPGLFALDDLEFTSPQQVPAPPAFAMLLISGAILFRTRGYRSTKQV